MLKEIAPLREQQCSWSSEIMTICSIVWKILIYPLDFVSDEYFSNTYILSLINIFPTQILEELRCGDQIWIGATIQTYIVSKITILMGSSTNWSQKCSVLFCFAHQKCDVFYLQPRPHMVSHQIRIQIQIHCPSAVWYICLIFSRAYNHGESSLSSSISPFPSVSKSNADSRQDHSHRRILP